MRVFASARIAVLDSEPERRSSLCQALSELGMERLLPVGTVEEARALLKGAPVDLCVVDGRAPANHDSKAGGRRIPPNPFDPARTPGILIATDLARETVRAATASGYRVVMSAPVVPRILYRRIGSILQKVRRVSRTQAPEFASASLAHAPELQLD